MSDLYTIAKCHAFISISLKIFKLLKNIRSALSHSLMIFTLETLFKRRIPNRYDEIRTATRYITVFHSIIVHFLPRDWPFLQGLIVQPKVRKNERSLKQHVEGH